VKVILIPNKGRYCYKKDTKDLVLCWPEWKAKRDAYELRWVETAWNCNCKGYSYRRSCSHLKFMPYKAPRKSKSISYNRKGGDGVLANAAKRTWVTLPLSGKRVNCYEYFWKGR